MSKAQAWPEPLADDDAAAVVSSTAGGLPSAKNDDDLQAANVFESNEVANIC